jgi:hypothetical protein
MIAGYLPVLGSGNCWVGNFTYRLRDTNVQQVGIAVEPLIERKFEFVPEREWPCSVKPKWLGIAQALQELRRFPDSQFKVSIPEGTPKKRASQMALYYAEQMQLPFKIQTTTRVRSDGVSWDFFVRRRRKEHHRGRRPSNGNGLTAG